MTNRQLSPIRREISASNAFIGACIEFDELIAKLQAARAEHFGVDADGQRNWGEVGSVAALNKTLSEGLAFITGTQD